MLNIIFMHHATIAERSYWMNYNATNFGFTWPSSGQTLFMYIGVFVNAIFCGGCYMFFWPVFLLMQCNTSRLLCWKVCMDIAL